MAEHSSPVGIKFRVILAALLLQCGVGELEFRARAEELPGGEEQKSAGIQLLISVVWEGAHFYQHNLDALKKFRDQYPNFPILSFVSPAYFVKPNLDPQKFNAALLGSLRDRDEIGLALYGWKSIVQKAGVIFRQSPTFWGSPLSKEHCQMDCGQEIPISIYREDEIAAMVDHSLKVFRDNHLPRPVSFLAGGWLATAAIFDIIAVRGFKYDFSAVPPLLVQRRTQNYPLYTWISNLWPNITPYTQPFVRSTRYSDVVEIGSTGAAVDYLTYEELLGLFNSYLNLAPKHQDKPLILNIGLYQETAHQYVPVLVKAMEKFLKTGEERKIEIRPAELPSNISDFVQGQKQASGQVETVNQPIVNQPMGSPKL